MHPVTSLPQLDLIIHPTFLLVRELDPRPAVLPPECTGALVPLGHTVPYNNNNNNNPSEKGGPQGMTGCDGTCTLALA